ncbi:hypothetical protein FHG87_020494 [Trinorchestia longiramus]|nr:hypothetical protein FHG87_020494 [Trinorchestia longiramus]
MTQFRKLLLRFLNLREPPDKPKVFQTIQKHLKLPLTGLREVGSGYNAFTEFESDVEKILTQKAMNTLTSIGLEGRLPPKIRAQRSVVCRQIDSWIGGKSADELNRKLRIATHTLKCGKLSFGQYIHVFKIEFTTINMVSHALQHGILCEHVKIAPSQIQQEKFIDILIYFNCYKLEQHTTKDRPTPNLTICPDCTGNHTYKNCTSAIKKCLNCKRDHRTMAMSCQTRKTIIKNKTKLLEEKEKEKQEQTYAKALEKTTRQEEKQAEPAKIQQKLCQRAA